jgi:hypothetical protein
MKKLTKYHLNTLIDLLEKQSWLLKKRSELLNLLSFCSNVSEQYIIIELLYRFKYLTDEDLRIYLNNLIHQIFNVWKYPQDQTQIVAFSNSKDPDSSESILWKLKPLLAEKNIRDVKLINALGKSVALIEKYPYIILIDEFSGTGLTVINRYKQLFNAINDYVRQKELTVDKFYMKITTIAAMSEAIKNIESNSIDIYSPLVLKKGISDNFTGKKLNDANITMNTLELKIKPKDDHGDFPSYGKGKAEALYAQELGNIPNSVFPIFWWPTISNGKSRKTLFNRYEEAVDGN